MTIEKLLGMSAEELSKMTELQTEKYWEPFFKVTRPEYAALNGQKKEIKTATGKVVDKETLEKLKELGLADIFTKP